MNLYLVKSRGLGEHYVVAKNTDAAYETLRRAWDAKNYGFYKERELDSIKLLAHDGMFHNSETRLRIVGRKSAEL